MVILIIIAIVVVLGLWLISAKNRIMREEQNVFTELNNAKLVVDRRFKNIESTVNMMKAHNSEIAKAYERVVQMRSGVAADSTDAEAYANFEQGLQSVAKGINIQVEQYPELGQFFSVDKFQTTMAQHDRDVELAKKLYNHEVEQFNTIIQTIPYNLVAGGKTLHKYWEVTDSEVKDEYIPSFE
ncbi:LemA family protein [Mollicutes bacterium LVI A0039]|nr:LemA family protein [Mollicutes bacterium LVI A0039]